MAEPEIIQDEGILRILKDLQQNKTLIKIRLQDKDYERLTLITSISKKRKSARFMIDYTAEFENAVADSDVWRLHFEFTGVDNIKYVFKTSGGEFFREKIWVNFPAVVERYQRRVDFRLEAPVGTRLYFTLGSDAYELLLKNVSLGGALGTLGNLNKKLERELKQDNNQILEDIELAFPHKRKKKISITIKHAKINRLERNSVTNYYEYALQFTGIDEENELRLTDLIYLFQRDYLRKRKLMKA
jgi:c-di-GMP-binding flagellar brake protein YcgR